ncbi:hypothetical protein [Geodermatophilus maliterrae]|uniref:Uncharacterized protein n=1 Tax=Geodermatophilus maliterrae TaxID=3162531 RepID=A0ABV3XFZ6_9ACTN
MATDEWSASLAGRRARWEVARLVNQVLEDGAHPARVSCGPGGFVVHSGTGRSVLADTATQLWSALLSLPGPPLHPQAVLDRSPQTPVAAAAAAAAARAAAKARTGEERKRS